MTSWHQHITQRRLLTVQGNTDHISYTKRMAYISKPDPAYPGFGEHHDLVNIFTKLPLNSIDNSDAFDDA